MKKRGVNIWAAFIGIILLLAIFQLPANAQRASAEFISSIGPPSLLTGQNVRDGIHEVIYNDGLLYVIDVWAGIQVVDVSNISKPVEIGRYQNKHRARNLAISGTNGYLADELEGVHILDLSNPRAIIEVGTVTTEGDAWWAEIEYPYLYVAEAENGVRVYDVSDPQNPAALSTFDTPGWAWGLLVSGDIVYVADKTGGLQIIDFTDKINPKRLGQFREPTQAKSLYLEDNLLFVTDGPSGLFILDVSNPKFPSLISKVATDGFIYDIFKGGKYAYLANESKSRLEIINLTDVNKPTTEADYQADDKIYGVWKEDVYVFVAANNKTLILRHNSPPVLADIEPQAVDEQIELRVAAQGYDPDGDKVYYLAQNLPEGAQFDSLSGVLTWTPTYEQSGLYKNISIRVIERTLSKLYTEKSFEITVNHVNRAPSLPEVEDQKINENQLLTFQISEGSDPDTEDKGRLRYSAENMPEGAVFDSTKRIFTWTPTFEQSGSYVIDFVIKDPPGAMDRDVCTITVHHVDRPPVLEAITDQTIAENAVLSLTLKGSDADKEDQGKISYSIINLPEGAKFDPQNQTFTWTPAYDQSGEYKDIKVVMKAGNLSDTTSFKIKVDHVSRPPVITDIPKKSADENAPLQFTINVSDLDAEDQGKLTVSAANLPPGATFDADSLKFTWTPNYEQSGQYNDIAFTVTDAAGQTETKSVLVTINHVNRPPVLTQPEAVTVDENVPVSVTITGTDPDVEDQNVLKYTAANLPQGATFEQQIISWTPLYEQSGIYTIRLSLSDGKLEDTKELQITVNHVNRPPVLEAIEDKSIDENQILEFRVVGSDPDKEDAEKWAITAANLPEGAQFDNLTSMFSWTPTFEQSGTYAVTFTITDPQGLTAELPVNITVNHVNRTPVLELLAAQTTDENTPFSYTIPAGSDPDAEDQNKLIYTVENLPEGAAFNPETRMIDWTPGFDQSGTYELIIKLTDGLISVQQPLQIVVNHVNRPPQIEAVAQQSVNENEPLSLTLQISDPDQEDAGKLQVNVSNLPAGASFNAGDNSVSWTPSFDQAGTYTGIVVNATDPAGQANQQTFDIIVNNVNRPPQINTPAPVTVAENAPVSIMVQASDPDQEDEGKLQFSAGNLPAGAAIDPATGALTWTPDYTQAGSYNISVVVTDPAGASAEAAASVEVTNVNRPPSIQAPPDQQIEENGRVSVSIPANDEDQDDQLRFSSDNLPAGASLDESSGTFTWTPDFDQAGDYQISVTVSDGEAQAATSFKVTVQNKNRPPAISGGGSVTVTAGETARLSFSASDPDDDALTFEGSGLPAGASLDANSGQFEWTPAEDQTGNFSFTVSVSDGQSNDETTGSVTVNSKPAPVETPQNEN